ncbi:MAG: hypothetical protein R2879_08265 [Saprospiraceae bacterium]
MSRILHFSILFLLLTNVSICQTSKLPDLQIGLHYWAVDFVDPGFLLTADYPLAGKQRGEKIKYLVGNFDIGFYNKDRSHSGINFSPGLSFRSILIPTGRFIDLKLNLGFQRSIYAGDVFEVDNQGRVFKSKDAGQNLFMPQVSFRFGKDWRFTHQKKFGWNLGVGLFARFLVNNVPVPGLFLTGGINYYLNPNPRSYEP